MRARLAGGVAAMAALAAAVLACGVAASSAATARPGCEPLARRLPRLDQRLPVTIGVTTPCGHFLVEASGAVVRSRPAPRPVPAGADWYPDLSWYRVVRGHLLIGVRHRFLWRSRRALATRYSIGAIERGAGRIAFSLSHGSASTLFVARPGGAEQSVGRGETPIGWTSAGKLVAMRHRQLRSGQRPESLVLLAPSGRLLRRIARDVWNWAWSAGERTLYLLAHGRLERFDGGSPVPLASLDALRIGSAPRLAPLGRLLAIWDASGIAVLDARSGAIVAAARLPRHGAPQSFVDSIAANAQGTAVAFVRNDRVAASSDPSVTRAFDTVYLLRAGARTARVLRRVPIAYATCGGASSVVWRGQSLVSTDTEGHAAILRPLTGLRAIELTQLVTRLSGDYAAEPIAFTVQP